MTQITIDIEKLGEVVARNISHNVPFEYQIWNAKECASYLRMEYKTFMNNYAPLPSFPKRIDLPSPRWKAQEVVEWAFRHKENR